MSRSFLLPNSIGELKIRDPALGVIRDSRIGILPGIATPVLARMEPFRNLRHPLNKLQTTDGSASGAGAGYKAGLQPGLAAPRGYFDVLSNMATLPLNPADTISGLPSPLKSPVATGPPGL